MPSNKRPCPGGASNRPKRRRRTAVSAPVPTPVPTPAPTPVPTPAPTLASESSSSNESSSDDSSSAESSSDDSSSDDSSSAESSSDESSLDESSSDESLELTPAATPATPATHTQPLPLIRHWHYPEFEAGGDRQTLPALQRRFANSQPPVLSANVANRTRRRRQRTATIEDIFDIRGASTPSGSPIPIPLPPTLTPQTASGRFRWIGGLRATLHNRTELDILNRALVESFEINSPAFIPSTASKIAALDRQTNIQMTCRICLQDTTASELVCTLPCTHAFHNDCIKHWLSVSGNCPLCRVRV
jgi:hypothetical protein